MRPLHLLIAITCACAIAGCSEVTDLVDSVTGGASGDEAAATTEGSADGEEAAAEGGETEAEAEAVEGATPAEAAAAQSPAADGATADDDGDTSEVANAPSGMPVVEGRSLDAAFAHVPAGPNGVMSLDVAALWAVYDAVYGEFASFLEPADMDELFVQFLMESDIPEAAARAIRVTELRDLVIAVWLAEESILMVTNVEAVPGAPADGGAAETFVEHPVQIARRGDHVIMGFGAGFTNALADGPRFSPSEWPAGWDALPENPAFMVFVPTLGDDPAAMLRQLDLPEDLAFTRAAAGVRTDGAMGLALDIADATTIEQGLGAMALGTQQLVESLRGMAPPAYAGWVEYVELARRALLSQLTYERAGTVSTLTVPAAQCGVQFALPLLVGAAYFGIEEGPGGSTANAPAWQNFDVATADGCGALAGPAPGIPRSLARLAPPDPNVGGLMVFWDLGGTLRGMLPTMGNLLPVALDHGEIRQALGEAPLGLAGLDDAEGSGALYFQVEQPGREGAGLLVAHRGLQGMLPAPENANASVRDGLGFVVVSEELAARVDAPFDATAAWPRTIAALPDDTVFAIGVDAGVAGQGEPVPIPSVQAVVDATLVAAMGITADYGVTARIFVDGDAAALATGIEPGLREFAATMIQSVPESEREMVEPLVDLYLDMFEFGHEGADIVTIEISLPTDNPLLRQSFMTGIGAAVAIPAFLQYQERSSMAAFDEEFGGEIAMIHGPPTEQLETIRAQAHRYFLTERVDAEGKALPMQFPDSVGFAPTLEAMRDACATNGNAFVANSDMEMYAAEGWRQLGIATYAPGSDHAVSFASEGAGPSATYTITVRADRDCDGVYSMFRTTGSVLNGAPVAGPVTEIEPNE